MWPFRTKKEVALDQRTTVVLARLENVVNRFEDAADRLETQMDANDADDAAEDELRGISGGREG